jgi:hypothetical protein
LTSPPSPGSSVPAASPPRGTPAGDTTQRPAFAYGRLTGRDIERARRICAGTLGVHPFAERDGHLCHGIGGCRFMVFASTGSAPDAHDQLGFVTAGLAGHLARMRAGGVVFEDVPGTSGGIAGLGPARAAWFGDSEGNLINLIEGNSPLWPS